ncbi:MAG TPA: Bax inhibitor-1/YccA family protein [Candidatus Limnocylindrales bacterium]
MSVQNDPNSGWGRPGGSLGPSGPFGASNAGSGQVGARPVAVEASRSFLTHAFAWMFAGLLLSAGVAVAVEGSPSVQQFALDAFLPVMLLQLVLVMGISWGINRLNATLALGLFFVYAASMGLTLGIVITAYALANGSNASVVEAFLSAAGMFGAAALYGATTKRSLAGLGGILFMGVIGLVIAMVVNIFLASSGLDLIISIIGVVIFTALTAYDVQRIQVGQLVTWTGSVEKAAVLGALRLYLDFVNLFLFLLRLFGNRR